MHVAMQLPTNFLHLFDGFPSFRCDAHDLGDNTQRFIRVKKSHSCNWMIYFADDRISLFAKIVGSSLETIMVRLSLQVVQRRVRFLQSGELFGDYEID